MLFIQAAKAICFNLKNMVSALMTLLICQEVIIDWYNCAYVEHSLCVMIFAQKAQLGLKVYQK
jgi:hypothetical protein